MTGQHLETIRANKRAAEELQPRSAFSAPPPQDATLNWVGCGALPRVRERVRAHVCVSSHVLISESVFSLAAAQKARHLQIKQTGFRPRRWR